MSNIRAGRHCVFRLHAHLVFVTKYRGKILSSKVLLYMQDLMVDICTQFEVELVEFNGESDHVHLLIHYPPKVQLSKLINALKGVSSRKIRAEFPNVKYHWTNRKSGALWSPSYFAGSVGGAPIEILKQYIEEQDRPR